MEVSVRRVLKWVLLILIAASIGRTALLLWHENDVEAKKSRAYILANEEIAVASGGVVDIIFKRKVSYHGTPSDPSYIEFSYLVNGNNDDLSVVVRGYGEPPKYSVKKIKNI